MHYKVPVSECQPIDRMHNVAPIFKVICLKMEVLTVAEKLNLIIFIDYYAYFIAKCLKSSTAQFLFYHLKTPRFLPSLKGPVILMD